MTLIRTRLAVGAVLTFGLVGASLVSVGGHRPVSLALLSTALADPLAIFASRSPGERPAGVLSDVKGIARAHPPAHARPVAHMLTLPYIPESRPSDDGGNLPGTPPASFGSESPLGYGGTNGVGSRPVDEGGGIGPLGSSTLSPSSPVLYVYVPPGEQTVVTPIVGSQPSAVPEPASWAVMILGFFGVGAMLRRARRRDTAATGGK